MTGQLLAQEQEHINCLVFIDGKLIKGIDGNITYTTDGQKESIKYNATIGEVYLNTEDYEKLKTLDSKNLTMEMSIKYTSYHNIDYEYYLPIRREELFSDYLLIRITNLKKKKKKYYVGTSSPIGDMPFIKKEYNMLEEY